MTDQELEELINYLRERQPQNLIVKTDENMFASYPWPGEEGCDFCGDPGPFVVFQTHEFTLDAGRELEWVSDGFWGACMDCMILLERKQRQELDDGCVEKVRKQHPDLPITQIRGGIQTVQSAFWEMRKSD